MSSTPGATLQIRSSRVLLDGAVEPAHVHLATDAAAGGALRVTSIERTIGGSAPREQQTGETPSHGATVLDLGSALVVPAPLDLHFHGAGGEVVPPGGDVAPIDAALRAAAEVTSWRDARVPAPHTEWLATLPVPQVPPADPVSHVADAARAIAAATATDGAAVAGTGCVGIRIEGLFLNPARAGVWPPETFRAPDITLLDELHAATRDAGSALRIIDIAPELPGALELIEHARALGVVVALAHTDATWEQARAAIDAGATLATHTWNAMRPVAHRDPGVVTACLTDPRVVCELICDGVHLHPGTVALSVAATGRGGWAVISDASPFAGCAPGEYSWGGTTVVHDGVALHDHAGHLAGSASLQWGARAVLRDAGIDQVDAAAAVGAVPRRVLDPARPLGLAEGDPVWVAVAL